MSTPELSKQGIGPSLGEPAVEGEGGGRVAALQHDVEQMRQKRWYFDVAPTVAAEIKKAVAEGLCSWQDLQLESEAELDELTKESQRAGVKQDLDGLRQNRWNSSVAPIMAKEIRDAVATGLMSWEDLDVDDEGLEQLARQNVKEDTIRITDNFRRKMWWQTTASSLADQVKKAVADGIVTWEELGMDSDELGRLVEENKQANPR